MGRALSSAPRTPPPKARDRARGISLGAVARPVAHVGLLLGLILGLAWTAETRWAPGYLGAGAFVTSDFDQYCERVATERAGVPSANEHRSRAVAVPLGRLAARVGVIDALYLGAVAGLCAVLAGVALHAGAVAGRLGAFAAPLTAVMLPPLVLIGRTLTWYPAMAGSFALASGGAAWALARGSFLSVAVGAALSFVPALVDARGVLWTLPCAGLVALGAVLGPPGRTPPLRRAGGAAVRLAVFVAIAAASWSAGREVWPVGMRSGIVAQMYSQISTVEAVRGLPPRALHQMSSACATTELLWGRTPLASLPDTLVCLADLGRIQATQPVGHEYADNWSFHVVRLLPAFVGATLLALAGVLPAPRRTLALFLPLLPAALALSGARSEADLRRLELGMLCLPPVLGVAVAGVRRLVVLFGARVHARLAGPAFRILTEAVALLLLGAVLTGHLRTWLTPRPLGSRVFLATDTPWAFTRHLDAPSTVRCLAAIAEDEAAGRHLGLVRSLPDGPGRP